MRARAFVAALMEAPNSRSVAAQSLWPFSQALWSGENRPWGRSRAGWGLSACHSGTWEIGHNREGLKGAKDARLGEGVRVGVAVEQEAQALDVPVVRGGVRRS